MKKILSAGICMLAGICIIYLYLLWHKQTAITLITPPTKKGEAPFTFSIDEAPKDALKAAATGSGSVMWTSRTATMPALLKPGIMLQQGEDVETGQDATVSFAFQNSAAVSLAGSTRVEINQSLPRNIVLRQTAGQATYVSGTSPVSVRVLHFIALVNGGTMKITLEKDTDKAVVTVIKGTVQIGYNDLDYQSITETLQAGDSFLYDDATRTGEIR